MKAKYKPVCDIFSLGLIFHILLFGKSIFKGKTYNEVLGENRSCIFDLNGHEYDHVEPSVMDLLRSMLQVIPEERISAEAALKHTYFQEDDRDTEEELQESLDKVEVIG
jgi:calcium-dependent protein kinase